MRPIGSGGPIGLAPQSDPSNLELLGIIQEPGALIAHFKKAEGHLVEPLCQGRPWVAQERWHFPFQCNPPRTHDSKSLAI